MIQHPIRHGLYLAGAICFVAALVAGCGGKKETTTTDDTSAITDLSSAPDTPPVDATVSADDASAIDSTFDQTVQNTASCAPVMGNPGGIFQAMLAGLGNRSATRVALVSSKMRSYFKPSSKRDACVSALSGNASMLGSFGDSGMIPFELIGQWLTKLKQWVMVLMSGGLGRLGALMGPLGPGDY